MMVSVGLGSNSLGLVERVQLAVVVVEFFMTFFITTVKYISAA
jgi:hypothetical protein